MGAVRQDNLQRQLGPAARPPQKGVTPYERYEYPYNYGATTCTRPARYTGPIPKTLTLALTLTLTPTPTLTLTRPERYTHTVPYAVDDVKRFSTFAREEDAKARCNPSFPSLQP